MGSELRWVQAPVATDRPMERGQTTRWSLVRGAAQGDRESREAFTRLYGPVIRGHLESRLRGRATAEDLHDAVQEVFLQCFKPDNSLLRADPSWPGGFRAFLYGITRNVAHSLAERRRRHQADDLPEMEHTDASLSGQFDREYARALTKEARFLLAARATDGGPAAERLRALTLRYEEGLPTREIARILGQDVTVVYPLMTRARREFRGALLEVLASYHPKDTREALEQRCLEIFAAL